MGLKEARLSDQRICRRRGFQLLGEDTQKICKHLDGLYTGRAIKK